MQIEHIKDVKLLKAMAEAAECHLKRIQLTHLKRIDLTATMTKEEFKEIQEMEHDILCIQIRIAEIEKPK